jgi:hypothetical protein
MMKKYKSRIRKEGGGNDIYVRSLNEIRRLLTIPMTREKIV